MKIHEASAAHRANVVTFQQMVHGDNVLSQLSTVYEKDRQMGRECLRQIFSSHAVPVTAGFGDTRLCRH